MSNPLHNSTSPSTPLRETEGKQLSLPLFPADMMQKIKDAHAFMELEKLRKEIEHLKHQRAGHMGAYQKLKNKSQE